MENRISFKRCMIDFEDINEDDFKHGLNIVVYSDIHSLIYSNIINESFEEDKIFGIFIELGKDKEKTLMLDVEIDDLELFAKSVLEHIKIIRNNYGEHIKKQIDLGVIS